jgi:hypothetical protein
VSEAAHDCELRIVGPSGGEFNQSFFVLLHFAAATPVAILYSLPASSEVSNALGVVSGM